MENLVVVGAGVSGLSVANLLKDAYNVIVFEKEECSGGLIKCSRVDGSLFHTCGGHVFNSKRQDVLDWYWSKFVCEEEFSKADRNSCVFLDKGEDSLVYDKIPYPIENHMYLFSEEVQKTFYKDLEEIDNEMGIDVKCTDYENFGDFLRWRFGKTLYNMYFEPYNKKVWRRDLSSVPMSWMEGKLPMPTTQEMRDNNANKIEEKSFVHSTFWYEKMNGSQYIANKLAEGLNIVYNADVDSIEKRGDKWIVCGQVFDKVVFCGNIKDMVMAVKGVDISKYEADVAALEYHGTTAVFCEIDKNPYSWIYLPSCKHECHRIICTGNFAPSNNDTTIPDGRITATLEFSDAFGIDEILRNLKRIPLNPRYMDHKYNKYTYPIQNKTTRTMIQNLKADLALEGFYSTGRFADWEYYNMDTAIGAAMDLCKMIKKDDA